MASVMQSDITTAERIVVAFAGGLGTRAGSVSVNMNEDGPTVGKFLGEVYAEVVRAVVTANGRPES